MELSPTISQKILQTGYGRFRPNKCGCHSWRWCYRGCWHQSFPPLIRQDIYSWQKPMQYMGTWDSLITLSCIVKVSRLLHPVGGVSVSVPFSGLPLSRPLLILGLVSRYLSNNLISRRLILRPDVSEKKHSSQNLLFSLSLSFPRLS